MSAEHEVVDVDKLAETLVKAYNCPKHIREQMGLNGKMFCDKHLNWDDIAKQFQEVFIEEAHLAAEKVDSLNKNTDAKELSNKIIGA